MKKQKAKLIAVDNPGDIVEIINDSVKATAILSDTRQLIVKKLKKPGSASSIARESGLPRQKVNYHIRELEKSGFVEFLKEKRKGNCIERIVRSTANSYVISPLALGSLAVDPADIKDKFSSAYQVAIAAKTIQDISQLRNRAEKKNRKLATFSLTSIISIKSPEQLNKFSQEMSECAAKLIKKYQDESAGSRQFNFNVGIYPDVSNESL